MRVLLVVLEVFGDFLIYNILIYINIYKMKIELYKKVKKLLTVLTCAANPVIPMVTRVSSYVRLLEV